MAFKRPVQRKILRDKNTGEPLPCVMCGRVFPLPEAAHIIDAKEWIAKVGTDNQANGIPLCPSCHKIFDEVFRPYLRRALEKFGASGLPKCWIKSNKISEVTDKHFPIS
jgi:5-methylcytosine-specific restriction endonuclease McrA